MKTFEWAIVGSGIAGISLAEILTRQGHSVVLIEKNSKLASETTREFHEWLHVGALYTLIPDRLVTLYFLLGAIDDLLEYYSNFERMNLIPTLEGLLVDDSYKGWFNNNFIHFKYRIKGRKLSFPWIIGIARSIFLIEKIHKHDWLRRRAGDLDNFKKYKSKRIFQLIKELYGFYDNFKTIKTSDFTINSRILIGDMVATAINNGLEISLNNEVLDINNNNDTKVISGSDLNFRAKNIALCNGAGIQKFSNVKTKISYAPIAVISGLPENAKSFVELDYFTKNCINLLTKENNLGLAGGISLANKSKCNSYLDYVVSRHKNLSPNILELSRYIGIKNEITLENQPRGYLYHIVKNNDGVWVVIPGKFSLAFSLAPEFYRRVYKKNPRKFFKSVQRNLSTKNIIANTVWEDNLKKLKEKNGNNKIT